MKQIDIQISLTEFVNFINASGMSKMTIVSNAKMRHEDEGNPFDYWKDFKDEVKKQLKLRGDKEDIWELVENVREDMRENYNQMINGYLKFWKPTRMEWLNPVKKKVHIGGVKMILNPEIGVKWQGKEYMIKLYMKANENLDKRHADIILSLLENELREKVEDNVKFAILDVRRGKLFICVNNDPKFMVLLKAEARSFTEIWREI